MTQYRRKKKATIIAVQLNLETDGFRYQKWGGQQHCKPGDWVANNDGDVYSIDAASFAATYRAVSPGVYEKHAPVWAEQAQEAGAVVTKEGRTAYQAGDWIVYNNPDRTDGYAMADATFRELYEREE